MSKGNRTTRPARGHDDDVGEALKALMIEATRLHYHVVAVSRAVAGPEDLTNGQVSLLRSVNALGPRTVPELAGERAIARQPVQRMCGELAALGLVNFEANPRHRRSRLVALTAAGRRRLRSMERRQSRWAGALGAGLSTRSIRTATRLLRRIHEQITQRAPMDGER